MTTNSMLSESEIQLLCRALCGNLMAVVELIEGGASIRCADYNGRTALHLAACRGHVTVVEFLLLHGAEINRMSNNGETPLDLALKNNHADVRDVLIGAGATRREPGFHSEEFVDPQHSIFHTCRGYQSLVSSSACSAKRFETRCTISSSVFFSEIVGYSDMCSNMDVYKLSNILSDLFRALDKLAQIHGIEKVDVIGDAYIAATNVLERQDQDHAVRIAQFAVDAIAVAQTIVIDVESSAHVQLRAGIHCGPVACGIIGLHGAKYTLIGDTVNTAARMRSTAPAGRVQCSAAAAALITRQASPGALALTARPGGTLVKGKGHMDTFWIESPQQGTTLPISVRSGEERSGHSAWNMDETPAMRHGVQGVAETDPCTPKHREEDCGADIVGSPFLTTWNEWESQLQESLAPSGPAPTTMAAPDASGTEIVRMTARPPPAGPKIMVN